LRSNETGEVFVLLQLQEIEKALQAAFRKALIPESVSFEIYREARKVRNGNVAFYLLPSQKEIPESIAIREAQVTVVNPEEKLSRQEGTKNTQKEEQDTRRPQEPKASDVETQNPKDP